MTRLQQLLCRTVEENRRTRRYQDFIDDYIDRVAPERDAGRGLFDAQDVELPHETIGGYWKLPLDERIRLAGPEATAVYRRNRGRGCIPLLGVHAFCWRSPLSRHHGDPELLRFFSNGIDFFTAALREDGSGLGALNAAGKLCRIDAQRKLPSETRAQGDDWSHTWCLEGLAYGLALCWDSLDAELRDSAVQRLRRSASSFAASGPSGEYGNQAFVQVLGLYLYTDLLAAPEYARVADAYWEDVFPKVMDRTGQVIEQGGPCLHYSFTTMIYAWLASLFREPDDATRERFRLALDWFRHRMTESLVPMAGPSSRQYRHDLPWVTVDLLPLCEWLGESDPMLLRFADRLIARHIGRKRADTDVAGAHGHGTSPMMWAMLMSGGDRDPTPEQEAAWDAPFANEYRRTNVSGRPGGSGFGALRYALVRNAYQTHFNFTDRLPFSGIQTWAYGDEPPIVHPTPWCPSTTQARGLDTARMGVSYEAVVEHGDGCNGPAHTLRRGDNDEGLLVLFARYAWLWRIVAFTTRSTVIVDIGVHTERQTRWTLNGLEPATAHIEDGTVSFDGRRGRIVMSPGTAVTVQQVACPYDDATADCLCYDTDAVLTASALSDVSFRFEALGETTTTPVRFADADGQYELSFGNDGMEIAPDLWEFTSVRSMSDWVTFLRR